MNDALYVSLFVPLFVPLILQMLIFQSKMNIMPRNFQDMILGLHKVHQELHGRSILRTPVCTLDFSNAYISAKNETMLQNFQDLILWIYTLHKKFLDYPLCVPLLISGIFQMLIFQPKIKIMSTN